MIFVGKFALSLLIGAGPASELDEEAAIKSAERHAARAEQQLGAEKLTDAADSFTAAYNDLPTSFKTSEIGRDFVDFAVGTRLAAYRRSSDPEQLQKAEALLTRFLSDVQRHAPSRSRELTGPAQEALAQVLDLRIAIEKREEEPAEASAPEPPAPVMRRFDLPPPVAAPARSAAPASAPADAPPAAPQRLDRVGLGLAIGGGALAVSGIALIAYGGWYVERTNREYDDSIGDHRLDTSSLNDWYNAELPNARIFIGVGAATAAVGLGLVTYGVVRLVRRKRAGNVALVPGRQTALRVRF